MRRLADKRIRRQPFTESAVLGTHSGPAGALKNRASSEIDDAITGSVQAVGRAALDSGSVRSHRGVDFCLVCARKLITLPQPALNPLQLGALCCELRIVLASHCKSISRRDIICVKGSALLSNSRALQTIFHHPIMPIDPSMFKRKTKPSRRFCEQRYPKCVSSPTRRDHSINVA